MQFRNTTSPSSPDVTLTGVMMNREGNSTATNGNERKMIPANDKSEYFSLTKAAGRDGQFATFIDIDENGRLDVILQKKDSNGAP